MDDSSLRYGVERHQVLDIIGGTMPSDDLTPCRLLHRFEMGEGLDTTPKAWSYEIHQQIVRLLYGERWTTSKRGGKQRSEPGPVVLGVVTIDDGASELVVHPTRDPGWRFPLREQGGSGDTVELLSFRTPIRPARDTSRRDQIRFNTAIRGIPRDLNRVRGAPEARRLEINEGRW